MADNVINTSIKLSYNQKPIFFEQKNNPTSVAYNIPLLFKCNSYIDHNKLELAIKEIIRKHPFLNTSFKFKSGEIIQEVSKTISFKLEKLRIRRSHNKEDSLIKKHIRPFNLEKGMLFRCIELQYDDSTFLLFDFHHIICDGYSIKIFFKELLEQIQKKKIKSSPVIKNVEYIDGLVKEKFKNKLQEYWRKKSEIAGFAKFPVSQKKTNYNKHSIIKGSKKKFSLSKNFIKATQAIAKEEKTSLFNVYLSFYCILLSRYNNYKGISIGTSFFNRRHLINPYSIGMFTNSLPIIQEYQPDITYKDLLKDLSNELKLIFINQGMDLSKLINQDEIAKLKYNTMFIYQNVGFEDVDISQAQLELISIDNGCSKFDLTFFIYKKDYGLELEIEYLDDLFNESIIDQIRNHYENIAENIEKNRYISISKINFLTKHDYFSYKKYLEGTSRKYNQSTGFLKIFKEVFEINKSRLCIDDGGKYYSYRDIDILSNQFGNMLIASRLGDLNLIPIFAERSVETIIAILGVIKAGLGYVPIDPSYPPKRIEYIFNDINSPIFIGKRDNLTHELKDKFKCMCPLEFLNEKCNNYSISEVQGKKRTNNSQFYVIYTSGTTGNPKGCQITDKNILNYSFWAIENYYPESNCCTPLFTSLSFDLTVTSLIPPLLSGSSIVVYHEEDPIKALHSIINDNKVNVVKLTPSHLKIMLDTDKVALSGIKRLIVGGEELTCTLAEEVRNKINKNVQIINEYGPTETTVGVTTYLYNRKSCYLNGLPIGRPIYNTKILILDKEKKVVPMGIEGEIYISGDSVSSGYFKNDKMTSSKYVSLNDLNETWVYRTGDFGYLEFDGNLQFRGRVDNQIKVNGNRIEIDEIKTQINKLHGIKEVIILKVHDQDIDTLICFYLSTKDLSGNDIKKHLISKLPDYMVPSKYFKIDKIPLTANGKADIESLTDIYINKRKKVENNLNTNQSIERYINEVIKDVLGKSTIDYSKSFYELGGDSIKALQVVSALKRKSIKISAFTLLDTKSIASLRDRINIEKNEIMIKKSPLVGIKTLTPIEKWFLTGNHRKINYYNQSLLLQLKKPINIKKLESSFNILIKRHDALRLNLNNINKSLFYNSYHIHKHAQIKAYDLSKSDDFLKSLNDTILEIKSTFNLTNDLLIRIAFIQGTQETNFLFFTAHHLLVDAVSWNILLEHMFYLYENDNNVELAKISDLRDWSNYLSESYNNLDSKEKKFWKKLICHSWSLPKNKVVSYKKIYKKTFILEDNISKDLKNKMLEYYNTSLLVPIIIAISKSLFKLTKTNDIVLDIESHGRNHVTFDVSELVGWLTTIYPFRIKNNLKIDKLLPWVKEELIKQQARERDAFLYQYMGDGTNIIKTNSQILINYLGDLDNHNKYYHISELDIVEDRSELNSLYSNIEFNVFYRSGKLIFIIYYNQNVDHTFIQNHINETNYFLKKIYNILQERSKPYFTPSDFQSVRISQKEINQIFDN